jgi:hypothetical protein
MSATRAQSLQLYRALQRTANQFVDYNFRSYSHRSIRDRFRENINETSPEKLSHLFKDAQEGLAILIRQTTINKMYAKGDAIIEKHLKR